ncbi:MAG: hypothetical protein P4M12_11095 [Gammaproteobacteria bacterium]|nr:hypothetical protein [Gammaproteobacteria bacterium]
MPFMILRDRTYTIEGADHLTDERYKLDPKNSPEKTVEQLSAELLKVLADTRRLPLRDVRGIEISGPSYHAGIYIAERKNGKVKRVFFDTRDAGLETFLRRKYPDVLPIAEPYHVAGVNPDPPKMTKQTPSKSMHAPKSVLDKPLSQHIKLTIAQLSIVPKKSPEGMDAELRAIVNQLKTQLRPLRSINLKKSEAKLISDFYLLAREVDKYRPNVELGAHHFNDHSEMEDEDKDSAMIESYSNPVEALIAAINAMNEVSIFSNLNKQYLTTIEMLLTEHPALYSATLDAEGKNKGLTTYLYAVKNCGKIAVLALFYDAIRRSGNHKLIFDTTVPNSNTDYKGWTSIMLAAFFNSPAVLTEMLSQTPTAGFAKSRSEVFTRLKQAAVNQQINGKSILQHLCEYIPDDEYDGKRIFENVEVLQIYGAIITKEMAQIAAENNPLLAEELYKQLRRAAVRSASAAVAPVPAAGQFFNPEKKRKSKGNDENVEQANQEDVDEKRRRKESK